MFSSGASSIRKEEPKKNERAIMDKTGGELSGSSSSSISSSNPSSASSSSSPLSSSSLSSSSLSSSSSSSSHHHPHAGSQSQSGTSKTGSSVKATGVEAAPTTYGSFMSSSSLSSHSSGSADSVAQAAANLSSTALQGKSQSAASNPASRRGYSTGTQSSTTASSSSLHTDDMMTRSEEQLLVGKERVETGSALLKKTIETEHVETSVPLIREKIVLEREPIEASSSAGLNFSPELKEVRHVVTVMEERPVVEKEVVAKERIRLGKRAEITTQTVGGDIRKEKIEFDPGNAPLAEGTEAFVSSGGRKTAGIGDLYNKDKREDSHMIEKEA